LTERKGLKKQKRN